MKVPKTGFFRYMQKYYKKLGFIKTIKSYITYCKFFKHKEK